MISIRPATPDDAPAIHHVHATAFPTDAEARLVDNLRANNHDELSLLAEENGGIVGHILFSPVTISRDGRIVAEGLGLAPVAVLPTHERRGIASQLIRVGIDALTASGCPFIVVLGNPGLYSRFGFTTASKCGLANEYGMDEPFMVLELSPQSLPTGGGLVKYGPEFAEFG